MIYLIQKIMHQFSGRKYISFQRFFNLYKVCPSNWEICESRNGVYYTKNYYFDFFHMDTYLDFILYKIFLKAKIFEKKKKEMNKYETAWLEDMKK